MFLDDKLLGICLDAEINTADDVQLTYDKLTDACQDYYKGQVHAGMPKKEVKVVIDRTFKLWDSFVRMAEKHDKGQVHVIGFLCKQHTFKDAFMGDEMLSALYNSL